VVSPAPTSDDAASDATVPTAGAPPSRLAAAGLDPERFDATVDLLVARDDHLAAAVAAHGRPGYWSRPATFATMVLFILEQQVSLASGKAVFDRLRALVGEVVPAAIADTPTGALREVGMTRQKASYVTGLAEGILVDSVDWTSIVTGDRAAARQALLAVRGIGPWTADVWLLACRGFPDEWPIGDRALQVGVGEVVGASAPLTGDDLVATGTRWAPHRSTAARLVWHAYLSDRSRAETVVVGLDP
jgi:DNA-3-methyladenine glycosylase II